MKGTQEADWHRLWFREPYIQICCETDMENPYWKDNEDSICALMEKDYEYCCEFREEDIAAWTEILLHFDGLDTVAEVYLNEYNSRENHATCTASGSMR